MTSLNGLLRAGAGASLFALLICVAWAAAHFRRIKREAAAHDALPQGGPKYNYVVLIGAAIVAFIALLTFCLVRMR